MYSTLDEVNSAICVCNKCETMNQGQRRVPGVGTIRPLIFFIGEAPGRLGADQTGIPFTRDRSGRLLRGLIENIGLSPENDIYISNIIKCNPRDEFGRNRHPSSKEIVNCREYLFGELGLVRARVVVPLGELASRELLGVRKPMKEINSREYYHKLYGRIFPLYHPGYIIRGNYSVDRYRQDFSRLKRIAFQEKLLR